MDDSILKVDDLKVSFTVEGRKVIAVDSIGFQIPRGKTVGLVGESGCGKSVTSMSITQLIPTPPGKIEQGQVLFNDQDLTKCSEKEIEKIRGNEISMIFQEPMTALNPVFTIGFQVSEVFIQHRGMSQSEARKASIEMLKKVGIPAPEKRIDEYPHQLSGGMRQRVMIAIALACEPQLLIADEPTTALDVTIQMQILQLMRSLQERLNMSILLVTHDLGVVAEMCDFVIVMYAGRIVESGPVAELFENPQHPYTRGLLASKIRLDKNRSESLHTIEGTVPSLFNMPTGCPFQDRCDRVVEDCKKAFPQKSQIGPQHEAACYSLEAQ